MKVLKLLSGALIFVFLFTGCLLDPDHSIRVKNDYNESINTLHIGSLDFGTVASGITTEYKPIDEGTFTISGSTLSGQQLSGSVSISGKGKHKWTMTITGAGILEIRED